VSSAAVSALHLSPQETDRKLCRDQCQVALSASTTSARSLRISAVTQRLDSASSPKSRAGLWILCLVLMVHPSGLVWLLLGSDLPPAGQALGRIAGFASGGIGMGLLATRESGKWQSCGVIAAVDL